MSSVGYLSDLNLARRDAKNCLIGSPHRTEQNGIDSRRHVIADAPGAQDLTAGSENNVVANLAAQFLVKTHIRNQGSQANSLADSHVLTDSPGANHASYRFEGNSFDCSQTRPHYWHSRYKARVSRPHLSQLYCAATSRPRSTARWRATSSLTACNSARLNDP